MQRLSVGLLLGAILLAPLPSAAQQDVVTVGTGSGAPGTTVDVPVFIRDTSGSPLGLDQPPGSRIQSYSIKVNYAPAASVQSVTFTRAGITAPLTPLFEASPSAPGTISLLDTFQESTNPIPFTLNAALPGNQVAHLLFTLAPGAIPGTVITLTLDSTLTQLTDEAGSPATKETVAAGNLLLVNGTLTVLAGPADLAIVKTASAPIYGTGQQITYTIVVSNLGPSPAGGTVVSDVIPAGTTFVSATPSQGSCSGTSTVTCTLGTIANGGSANISLVVTAPSTSGSVSNTATVTSSNPDSNPANNSATATAIASASIPTVSPLALMFLAVAVSVTALLTRR